MRRHRAVDISEVKRLAKEGLTQADIARALDHNRGVIAKACKRHQIECARSPMRSEGGARLRFGKTDGRQKVLTVQDVTHFVSKGESQAFIAELYGVTPPAVHEFIRRRNIGRAGFSASKSAIAKWEASRGTS